MKKIIVLIVLILFMLTGCSKANVDKKIKKTDDEVISYVNQELKSKYSNISISLSKKEQAYTVPDFCLDYCPNNKKIKGAYEYTFNIKDSNGNIAYAIYYDGFKNNKENYDNKLIESYGAIGQQKEELERYSNLINIYFDNSIIKNKYYEADFISRLYHTPEKNNKVNIIYKVDLNLDSMSYSDLVKFNSLAYDKRAFESIEYHNVFSSADPEIYILFNDKESPIRLANSGLEKIETTENSTKFTIYEKENQYSKNDYTDYYSIKSHFNNRINENELNTILSIINNNIKPYINKVGNIYSKEYDNPNGEKTYSVCINSYTKNNYLFKISIKYKYDSDTSQYVGDIINMFIPYGYNENSDNGVVIKTWKIH